MTNILADRIQNAQLTKTQQKIAKYFMRNQERIGSLSSVEAAREIGVSDASIIRFSRAIGYEGFADLKADIYDALVKDAFSGMSLTERMDQSARQYPEADIASDFLELMQRNLTNSFLQNEPKKYEELVNALVEADRRFVVGLRGCKGVAVHFSRLLAFMLPNVACIQDSECVSINTLQDAGAGDLVLMFAFARYYKIDVSYLKMARASGAKVCLVIDDMVSPLSAFGDIVLLVETEHMSFFNSALGATLLAEYLLTLVSRKAEFQKRIETRDEVTAYQRLAAGKRKAATPR